jgi:hypothetical protein
MQQGDKEETDERRAFAFWQRDQHIERVNARHLALAWRRMCGARVRVAYDYIAVNR